MQYWLMKSEPNEFSIDDLLTKKRSLWDGIRNYQVRNMLRDQVRVGDQAFFYHSNTGKETGIVGLMEIVREAYPDPTQFDATSNYFDPKSNPSMTRWFAVDVKFIKKFNRPVLLSELRNEKKLSRMALLKKGNRLSVTKLSKNEFLFILRLAENKLYRV
ncbi:EVE domain-containing protein [Candidatus Kaiserbacteria bacterium]|nr:EVE domain-containing protein [Candidatus Kaiserbacteria bacterium]NCT01748.1 EVE domain-containing protein [Candidatus Parcubacteria bacterium]